ncbi:hypothetical protein DTL42_00810 [Bremerella cremea]|uniref:Uncharacterized protein n=1 Tax=Bremerella cremea TaxID=1031537 RepID=A0A368KXJ0_9BACT|nr:hypothetical protein DTL42_00810 [Bremerella cremea]
MGVVTGFTFGAKFNDSRRDDKCSIYKVPSDFTDKHIKSSEDRVLWRKKDFAILTRVVLAEMLQ